MRFATPARLFSGVMMRPASKTVAAIPARMMKIVLRAALWMRALKAASIFALVIPIWTTPYAWPENCCSGASNASGGMSDCGRPRLMTGTAKSSSASASVGTKIVLAGPRATCTSRVFFPCTVNDVITGSLAVDSSSALANAGSGYRAPLLLAANRFPPGPVITT